LTPWRDQVSHSTLSTSNTDRTRCRVRKPAGSPAPRSPPRRMESERPATAAPADWLRHVGVDRAEGVADLRAQRLHDQDDDGCDEGHQQAVLDRGRAALLTGTLAQAYEPGLEPHVESEHLPNSPPLFLSERPPL